MLGRIAGRTVCGIAGFATGAALVRVAAGRGDVAGAALMLGAAVLPFLALWVWSDPRVAIALVFATLPIPFAMPAGPVEFQLVDFAIAFAVLAVVASRLFRGVRPFRIPPAVPWLIVLSLWCVVSTLFAEDVLGAAKGTASFVEAVAFLIAAYTVVRSMRDLRWLLVAFVAVAAVVAVGTLSGLQQMSVAFGGASVQGRAAGVFENATVSPDVTIFQDPNQFGAYMSTALFAAIALLLSGPRLVSRVLAGLGALVITAALLLSLSRGAWIGAAVGLVFVAVFAPAARPLLLRVVAVAAVAAVGAVALQPSLAGTVRERLDALTVRGPYDERPAMWREGFRQVVADPITGSGPANYRVEAEEAGLGAFAPFHAHDFLLTWAAETGIPGAALMVAFALVFGRRVASTVRRTARGSRDRTFLVALTAASVAFAVHGVVHYTSRAFDLYAMIAFALAACALLDASGTPRIAASHDYGARSPVRTAVPVRARNHEGSDRHGERAPLASLERR